MLSVACITGSQAFCCASVKSPHITPARVYSPCGRFDQRCFCSVLLQSNCTLDFWLLSSVARKALAAATILGATFSAVPAVALVPAVGALAAVASLVVVAPAAAAAVGAAMASHSRA